MKTIRVAAAILCDAFPHPTAVFAAARGYGEQKGGWEFPGGKLEPGEAAEEAIVREIREELEVTIAVRAPLQRVEYDYPAFHLSMDCLLCTLESGTIRLREAADGRWLTAPALDTVPWLPADRLLLPALRELLEQGYRAE